MCGVVCVLWLQQLLVGRKWVIRGVLGKEGGLRGDNVKLGSLPETFVKPIGRKYYSRIR